MKQHSQVLVPPLHDAARDVERFRARLGRLHQPGEVIVPGHQLVVNVLPVFGAEERACRQGVLDLGRDFAELDVLDHGEHAGVLRRVGRLVVVSKPASVDSPSTCLLDSFLAPAA